MSANVLFPIPMTRASTRDLLGPDGVNVTWGVNVPSQEWNTDGSWRGCFIFTGDNYQKVFTWGASNEEGTLQCEVEVVNSSATGVIWELSDSTGAHRIQLRRHTNNSIRLSLVSAGQTFTDVITLASGTGVQNIVISWQYVAISQTEQIWSTSTEVFSTSTYRFGGVTPEFEAWRNGTLEATYTGSASIPKGMTTIFVGQDYLLANRLNGWLRSLTPFTTRQTDSNSLTLSEVI